MENPMDDYFDQLMTRAMVAIGLFLTVVIGVAAYGLIVAYQNAKQVIDL